MRWPGRWRRVGVRGPSMSPTLHDGDVVLARFGAAPRPGDVVLVGWATRPGQLSVKRAVRPDGDGWWVLGDNPFGSTDSRTLGPAQVRAVVRGAPLAPPRASPRVTLCGLCGRRHPHPRRRRGTVILYPTAHPGPPPTRGPRPSGGRPARAGPYPWPRCATNHEPTAPQEEPS